MTKVTETIHLPINMQSVIPHDIAGILCVFIQSSWILAMILAMILRSAIITCNFSLQLTALPSVTSLDKEQGQEVT